MTAILRVLATGLFLLFVGASVGQTSIAVPATHPISPPAPAVLASSSSTVYFYRLRKAYAAALKPSVTSDGKQLLRMRNGRFISLQFPAGSHTITSTFPGNGLVLDAKAGETYYVRLEMTMASMLHASRGEVTLVDPSQGKFEVTQLKPGEPGDTKDGGGNAEKD